MSHLKYDIKLKIKQVQNTQVIPAVVEVFGYKHCISLTEETRFHNRFYIMGGGRSPFYN